MALRNVRASALALLVATSIFGMSGCAPVAPDGDGALVVDIVSDNAAAQSLAAEISIAADALGLTVETRLVESVPEPVSADGDSQIEADLILTSDVGAVMELADSGLLSPVSTLPGLDPEILFAEVGSRWLPASMDVDGNTVAFPVAVSLASVTFMNPLAFAEHGYEVPTSPAEFAALVERIEVDNAGFPWCAGMENGNLTADPFIDWLAEYVLATEGSEFYRSWVAGDIPSSNPAIEGAAERVRDYLAAHSSAKGEPSRLLDDGFANTVPMFDLVGTYGKQCFFVRQRPDFVSFVPDTVSAEVAGGEFRQISAFPFMAIEGASSGTQIVDAVFAGIAHVDKDVIALLSAMSVAPFGDQFSADTAWVSARGNSGTDSRLGPFVSVNRNVVDATDDLVLSPRSLMTAERLDALRGAAEAFLSGESNWSSAAAAIE